MKKFRDVLSAISLILVIGTLLPLMLMFWRSFERGYYEIPVYLDGHLQATVNNNVQGSLSTIIPGTVKIDQR